MLDILNPLTLCFPMFLCAEMAAFIVAIKRPVAIATP